MDACIFMEFVSSSEVMGIGGVTYLVHPPFIDREIVLQKHP